MDFKAFDAVIRKAAKDGVPKHYIEHEFQQADAHVKTYKRFLSNPILNRKTRDRLEREELRRKMFPNL